MWPFGTGMPAVWLVLYVLTFALHALFISYVVTGTGYALVQTLRRANDPLAERIRDRLPFMLGLAITAGVAPLLFLQLLYQHRFYTANLLLGPRWGAVVPALVIGFYALYVAKAAAVTWRRLALGIGLGCFVFVAWSWTELHLVMEAEPVWRDMYAAGDRVYGTTDVWPRLMLWLGVMATLFATVAVWSAGALERQRLAVIALAGRAISGVALGWLSARGGSIDEAAGWGYVMLGAMTVEVGAWIMMWRAPGSGTVKLVAGAAAVALITGSVVREAPRIVLLEPSRPAAVEAGGFWVFVLTLVVGIAAISWIVRTVKHSRA